MAVGGRSGKLTAGGILCISAGVIGLVLAILTLIYAEPAATENGTTSRSALLIAVLLTAMIPSAIAILGGYFALQRRNFWLAIVGGAAGFLSLPLLFLWLPIPAVILIWMSRNEFQ